MTLVGPEGERNPDTDSYSPSSSVVSFCYIVLSRGTYLFPPVLYYGIMADKKMISAKMGDRTVQRLEQYAEREGISRSQATERMCKQGLDVEESDMRLVPVKTDGGTQIENQLTETQNQLQNQQTVQRHLNVILLLSIFWLAVHLVFSVPSLVTILTGIVLVGGLSYSYIRYWRD